ncbi:MULTISPECIES: tandem-95 repeat protein [Cupriavidus]
MKKFSVSDPCFELLAKDSRINISALKDFINQVNVNPVLNSYMSRVGDDLDIRLKTNNEVKDYKDGAFFDPRPDDNNGKYAIALNPDWFVGPNAKFPTTATLTVSHELDHYTRVADLQRSTEILNDPSRSPLDRLSGYVTLRMQTEVMGARAEFQALRAAYGIAQDAPIPERYQLLLSASDRQLLKVEADGYAQGLRGGALDTYFAEHGAGVLSRNTTYWERYTDGIAQEIGVPVSDVARLRSDLAYKLIGPDDPVDWDVRTLTNGQEQVSRTYANGQAVVDVYDATGRVGREVTEHGAVIERSATYIDGNGQRVTTTVDGSGKLLSTSSEQRFDDGSSRTQIEYPDGRIVLATTDADGTITTQVIQEAGSDPQPSAEAALGSVRSLISLLQAIESGDARAIALASAAMLSNIDALSGGQFLPHGVAGGLNALAAGMNLVNAIQDGNGWGIAASSLNLGSQAAAIYAGMLKDQGIAAFQAESASAGALLENGAAMGQVAGAVGLAASIATLVMAIDDGSGVQIAGAALGVVAAGLAVAGYTSYCPPVAFAAVAVTMIGSAVFAEDLPTLEGEATAVWNPDGTIQVLKTTDGADGGATPAGILQSLVGALQVSLAHQVDANGDPLYAIIPQRLPTIGYIFDPDGARLNENGGQLYLKWIDEHGQEQTRYYDGAGLRYDHNQASLAQEFVSHAFSAVVPAWEAESVLARMREAGAVTALATGSVDENRARVAQQLHSGEWQEAKADAGLPREDADGIHQHFIALTVDLMPEPPAGTASGRIGKNVDLDAYVEQTDWVKANQGILSIDANGDGRISQDEILTNDQDAAVAHARNSLQWLDVNHDGRLDAADPAFAALGIWLDVNRNGQTDDGEFASFLDRGIACLDFSAAPPVLLAKDGTVFNVTEQHLSADVRGDYYQAAFVDMDGDGSADTFAGVLHAREGGETVLNAVATHDYTGEAGHTQGGLAAEGSGEMRLAAGDERVQTASDRQHEQIRAEDVIAAGDIRVTDGEAATAGNVTSTSVDAGDERLTSRGDANDGKTAQRVDTVRPNDGRVIGAQPVNPADAYAAIRDAWIKSSDGLFGGTGALLGVAVGAVAGVAKAQNVDDAQAGVTDVVDATGNNTVSRVPAPGIDTSEPPATTTTMAMPQFVPTPVDSLPAAQRPQRNDVDPAPDVNVVRSQIESVLPDGERNVPDKGADLPPSPRFDPGVASANGEDVRMLPPDVADERVEGVEDSRYAFDAAVLLDNDSTRNFTTKPLRLVEVFGAEHGTVVMDTQPDGSQRIVFTPDQDYWGPARFRYVVEDEYGLQSMGRVYLDIAPVNDAPVAAGENAVTDEDTGILLTSAQLLANDFDVDTPTVGDVLAILRVSDPQNGLVALDKDGNVRFLPDPDYFGPASFVYWVSDGNGGLTPATVSLEIRPVNDAPVVAGETITTDEDTVLLIEQATLLANDTDVDNPHADLTVFSVRDGQHGSVELTPDGLIRFVPEQDFHGTATFFYTVCDGAGGYTEARATVELAPVNDAPIVTGEDFRGNEDEVATFTAASLLSNDRDVDDPQAGLTLLAVGNALHGEVRLHADGSVTFIPEADYFGAASFEYTVSDPHGATTTGRVDIELAPVNDAPRLRDDVIAGIEDTALTIDAAALLANDIDVDNRHDELTITRVGDATHGKVSLNPDGTIRFVPDQDFFGDATFVYEVADGAGGMSVASATIHVAPVNDAPIANDNIVDGRKGVAVTMTAAVLLADDFDIDNPHGDLRIIGVSNAEHGTVRLNADGSVTFLPDPGYGGFPGARGEFTYTISDGAGGLATATTTVNLEKINTTPVAVDDGFSGYENTPFIIHAAQFLANDSDPDGDALVVTQVANARHGTVEIQADGQIRFTPATDFHGQASFQYLVSDAYGGQTWATAYLDVAHVNKAPVIEAIEYGTPVFGYYYGPAKPAGYTRFPMSFYYDGDENSPQFQPLHDEALAISLAARGELYRADGSVYQPDHYLNGMLKPLEITPFDSVSARKISGTVDATFVFDPSNDPLRECGRIIAYDPDGSSSAIVMSIVQGPQHGYAYANTYTETVFTSPPYGTQDVNAQYYWQYKSHLGDPYNGQDSFTIRIQDAQGAYTDVAINATHKGTNASGSLTPLVLSLDGDGVGLPMAADPRSKAGVNDDGEPEQIGWAAAAGGVPGFDADGDGRISVEETPLANFAPGADAPAAAAADDVPAEPSPAPAAWTSGADMDRSLLLFVQMMNTQIAPMAPIGFVPPHEDTLADVAARAAQAATVDAALAQH